METGNVSDDGDKTGGETLKCFLFFQHENKSTEQSLVQK